MKGWHNESYRHYLASKGVSTSRNKYYVTAARAIRAVPEFRYSGTPAMSQKFGGVAYQKEAEARAEKEAQELEDDLSAGRVGEYKELNKVYAERQELINQQIKKQKTIDEHQKDLVKAKAKLSAGTKEYESFLKPYTDSGRKENKRRQDELNKLEKDVESYENALSARKAESRALYGQVAEINKRISKPLGVDAPKVLTGEGEPQELEGERSAELRRAIAPTKLKVGGRYVYADVYKGTPVKGIKPAKFADLRPGVEPRAILK